MGLGLTLSILTLGIHVYEVDIDGCVMKIDLFNQVTQKYGIAINFMFGELFKHNIIR